MKLFSTLVSCLVFFISNGQELYPFSDPASNMPARSLSTKITAMYGRSIHTNNITQRYMPEIMLGVNKNLMLHTSVTFSDMHDPKFYFESARAYAKYRFYSKDDVHKHFRMAAFIAGSYSRNHLDHNELSLMGDHSGVQVGLIATQLVNKLAVSATVGVVEVFDKLRWDKDFPQQYAYQSIAYSLSGGYLLLPKEYTSYDQTNVNLYLEFLGGYNLDWKYERGFIDAAPSVQFIFKSNSKLNIGYRFELAGDVYRLMDKSWMISYEYVFLNVLKNKKK